MQDTKSLSLKEYLDKFYHEKADDNTSHPIYEALKAHKERFAPDNHHMSINFMQREANQDYPAYQESTKAINDLCLRHSPAANEPTELLICNPQEPNIALQDGRTLSNTEAFGLIDPMNPSVAPIYFGWDAIN